MSAAASGERLETWMPMIGVLRRAKMVTLGRMMLARAGSAGSPVCQGFAYGFWIISISAGVNEART